MTVKQQKCQTGQSATTLTQISVLPAVRIKPPATVALRKLE
jgi:hypothetical protein